MRIVTTYPGQEPQEIEAPPHILDHCQTKGWSLPFVEVCEDSEHVASMGRLRACLGRIDALWASLK